MAAYRSGGCDSEFWELDTKNIITEIGGMDMRAHTVILGAGATMAAISNGDRYGKKSSVMNEMISKLGLDDLLADVELETKSENIEDIYSELYMKSEYVEVVRELEKRLYDYFDSFEIPDAPTVYDFLILSLTEKDVIATFNWAADSGGA